MITLIGTGHIFNLNSSLHTILEDKHPDIIGVELDPQRYQAMMLRTTDPARYDAAKKDLPAIYKMLGRFQEDMAQHYGVNAGDEMLTAISYAQNNQLPVAFIDTDAQNLFITMWKTMPFLEKFRLILSGLTGLLISKKRVEQELEKYQDNYDTYLQEIGKKFPTITRVLIDERNQHMAAKLTELHQTYQHIVACVGDGHIPGITHLLQQKNIPHETIRLADLRTITPQETDGTTAHFSINYRPL